MRALLDVNVLIAMFQPDHVHHRAVRQWWHDNRSEGWASCPLTQNGFVRIVSQPRYSAPLAIEAAILVLRRATETNDHAFWPDDVSLLDGGRFDPVRIQGPNQVTDTFLLGLAVKNGGRLVTFDRGISIQSVRDADERHLIML